MKKKNDKGFMLIETLIVTAFVAGVLIFLFIQFTNLSKSYDESYIYNTTETLYALEDIKNYINSDTETLNNIVESLKHIDYINIKDCSIFSNEEYCIKLFELEGIEDIIIMNNEDSYDNYFEENEDSYSEGFKTFLSKINIIGEEPYRIVASFKNNTYATLRFGE